MPILALDVKLHYVSKIEESAICQPLLQNVPDTESMNARALASQTTKKPDAMLHQVVDHKTAQASK